LTIIAGEYCKSNEWGTSILELASVEAEVDRVRPVPDMFAQHGLSSPAPIPYPIEPLGFESILSEREPEKDALKWQMGAEC
jgi:hypothetical protein